MLLVHYWPAVGAAVFEPFTSLSCQRLAEKFGLVSGDLLFLLLHRFAAGRAGAEVMYTVHKWHGQANICN